jgi:hypothetical protein
MIRSSNAFVAYARYQLWRIRITLQIHNCTIREAGRYDPGLHEHEYHCYI